MSYRRRRAKRSGQDRADEKLAPGGVAMRVRGVSRLGILCTAAATCHSFLIAFLLTAIYIAETCDRTHRTNYVLPAYFLIGLLICLLTRQYARVSIIETVA